jgi:DsbC/DsbD-like thiol-disulfide interchange protein
MLALSCIAFTLAARAAIPPGEAAGAQDASAVVKSHTYVSLEPVPRGREFQVAVVVEIARGFHMNSHKPTDPYLIPTTLTVQLPAGFQLLDTVYPQGTLENFSFSPNKPLDVYTGSVTLRLRLSAQADAARGAAKIPITLRYQACNDTTCLPPVKLPVDAKIEVAEAGVKAHPLHPEIFSSGHIQPLQ